MKTKLFGVTLTLILLSGCATDPNKNYHLSGESGAQISQTQLITARNACLKAGWKIFEPRYDQCIENELASNKGLYRDALAQYSISTSHAPLAQETYSGVNRGYGCAENGSCYGDISTRTGQPKTIQVDGYYRKDGTYVRGHYRSVPSRRR